MPPASSSGYPDRVHLGARAIPSYDNEAFRIFLGSLLFKSVKTVLIAGGLWVQWLPDV